MVQAHVMGTVQEVKEAGDPMSLSLPHRPARPGKLQETTELGLAASSLSQWLGSAQCVLFSLIQASRNFRVSSRILRARVSSANRCIWVCSY